MAIVQKHKITPSAVQPAVLEERLASPLKIQIPNNHDMLRHLDGICNDVIILLRDHHVAINTFRQIRRLKPMRQIAVAETMIALNCFSISCAKSFVASSPRSEFVNTGARSRRGLTGEQLERMEKKSTNLERKFKVIEQEYGTDHLDLVFAIGYLCRLIDNVRLVHHLARHHPQILAEFQEIAQLRSAA
ncbi:MAG: plasmid stablization protein ParB [Sphingomonadales bacterium]|nr:plasmid stablization protein ParB [Sphingomonadales bacterium]